MVRGLLTVIVVLLGIIAMQLVWSPQARVSADSARFDHVYLLSAGFLYQGQTGVLLMDRRNGNVWFLRRGNPGDVTFKDPVFLVRLPLDKLDEAPR